MARRCGINASKGVLAGNNVSHSNRKTRRRFLPNLQTISLMSDALGHRVSVRLSANSIRTIEHNDGIDNYLLNTSSRKLAKEALTLKKRIQKALSKKSTSEVAA
jgi:large subunit ribosomal protein L28